VGSSVWKHHGIVVFQQELCIAEHPHSVIGKTVQQEHTIAIPLRRADEPSLQGRAIPSFDRDVLELCGQQLHTPVQGIGFLIGKNSPGWV
jgi:hypothetical protein